MTVKEIVLAAAFELGVADELKNYLDSVANGSNGSDGSNGTSGSGGSSGSSGGNELDGSVDLGGSEDEGVDTVSVEGLVETTEGKKLAEALVRCFNIVESELAVDYLPLLFEEEFETETGVVYYSELARSVVRVVKVTDAWGNEAPFKLFPEYLKTQAGQVKVRYTYAPREKTLSDSSDYLLYASVRLFAYGIAAEYSLSCGYFEDAAVWDKKYKDAIAAVYRKKPCRKIQSRRWV